MQCPHCRHQEDDAASECSRCGFQLAKWRANQQTTRLEDPSGAATVQGASAAESSGWGTVIWTSVLLIAGAVWYLNRAGTDASAGSAPVLKGTAAADPSKGQWHFEGTVKDLARDAPIKGAKVYFIDLETGRSQTDTTDDQGHYAVDVDVRWKLGYGIQLEHPLYLKHYWPGAALAASRKDRLKMGFDPDAGTGTESAYRGVRTGAPVTLDFALFPQDLTDEERALASQ